MFLLPTIPHTDCLLPANWISFQLRMISPVWASTSPVKRNISREVAISCDCLILVRRIEATLTFHAVGRL